MSVLTLAPPRREYDPLLDKSYRDTALGPDVAAFLAWMEVGDKSPRTLDSYERSLARGALMFPDTRLELLSDDDVLHIAKSFTPKQRAKRMAAWRSFYRWALRSRRVTVNPCDALPEFKPARQKVFDVFSEEEVAVLCDLPVRDGALMQLMFDAGLRKGECRRFKLAHLRTSGERDEVVILSGKGGKDRAVPATLAVSQRVGELALLDGLKSSDHLWYSTLKTPHMERIGRDRTPAEGTFHRWWVRSLEQAGIRYRNPHMTRHTFATRYLRRGGTLERLSLAMGHDSIRTTNDLYAHLVTADLFAEFDRVFSTMEAK